MDMLSDKKVKLRKPCRCFGCGRSFAKGQTIRKTVTVDSGDINTAAWCEVCTAYWNKFMGYGDTVDFGELKENDAENWEKIRMSLEANP